MKPSKYFVFRFDDVEVREREFTLTKAGKVLAVEPKAFRTLLFLLHNPQRLIAKEELLNTVWADAAVTEGSLTRCIWLLRTTLGDDVQQPRYIATVATVGYRFVCAVEVSEDTHGLGGSDPVYISADAAGETLKTKPRDGAVWSLRRWWLLPATVLVVGLAAGIWYLRRPLPPPRISGYTQITPDGHEKVPIGTDGSRLYFSQNSPTIGQVGVSGGEIVQIPVPVPLLDNFDDVSPDGSNLLVESLEEGSHRVLWNVRIPGGSLRRLGEAIDAAFSPDGKSVIYSTLGGDIYLVWSDGTGTHKLASVGPEPCWFSWSPDGGIIRFYQDDKLWQMSSDGSNIHQLLSGWRHVGRQCCGRWTPDGKFFVFLSGYSNWGRGGQIWALDERRGLLRRPPAEPVQLTTGPLSWSGPIPGRDGKSIFAEGIKARGELSRFDAKAKQFQPFLGDISGQGITFSKDGQSVAYVSFPEGVLWKASRDGSNPMQLTDPPMDVFMPRWSPDGTQILFSDISSGSEIYIVSPQGGIPHKLLPKGSGKQSDPDWSPDGHKVVFGTSFGAQDPKGQIRIFDPDSQKISTIPGSGGMTDPRWSPDGRSIVAPSFDLRTMNIFDVGTQRWSAWPLKMEMVMPEWSRDSRFIYFLQPRGDDQGVYRVSVKAGEAERVVGLKNWLSTGWFGGLWTGLDPTDAPLLLRDIGSNDIYALTLEQK
jgi:Tol biopolymer transport system component/DNA-binding winged helix-turn-helix (wHTH) protein